MKLSVKRHEVVQPQDQSIRLIPLTQGQTALVDAIFYDYLMQWNWRASWSPLTKTFYATRWSRNLDGTETTVYMHKEILTVSVAEGIQIDHINTKETLDNRLCNLRASTRSQNGANSAKQSNNTSGYIGVSWRKDSNCWRAYITVNKHRKYLGQFSCAIHAARAYDAAARKYFGDFAHLNFPK